MRVLDFWRQAVIAELRNHTPLYYNIAKDLRSLLFSYACLLKHFPPDMPTKSSIKVGLCLFGCVVRYLFINAVNKFIT
jgi:hypothetical protein